MIILDYFHVDSFGKLSEYNNGVAGGRGWGRSTLILFFFTDCLSTVARYFRS